MGLKVTGEVEVSSMLMRLDSTAKRRVLRELVVQGRRLQQLAIRMAPVDKGNLEAAIKMRPESAGPVRDSLGRFARQEVEVYIDLMASVGGGHVVGDYAWEVHEHMFPYGYKQLGPRSRAKQAADPRVIVGGGFMDRAAAEVEKGLDDALRDVLNGLF